MPASTLAGRLQSARQLSGMRVVSRTWLAKLAMVLLLLISSAMNAPAHSSSSLSQKLTGVVVAGASDTRGVTSSHQCSQLKHFTGDDIAVAHRPLVADGSGGAAWPAVCLPGRSFDLLTDIDQPPKLRT